jgi:Zn-finger nucleic acid-binding protein
VKIRAEREDKRQCFSCQQPMEKHVVLNVILDKCPTCRGVWLDAGELELVKEAAESETGDGFTTGLIIGMAVG